MTRYTVMFNRLKQQNQGAFVPFVMLGDPDVNTSIAIIQALIAGGADALELGFPFSDPIADGPTIQKASIRALNNQVSVENCFSIIAAIRKQHANIPVGLLLYSNLVFKRGINAFYQQAASAGVDSILIADVPLREVAPFMQAAKNTSIDQILIAPPNANSEILAEIAQKSSGYTYLLGRAGVTGAETAANIPTAELVTRLGQAAPPLLGFGISNPEQVKYAIQAGAAGAISGSATVNIIEANLNNLPKMYAELTGFVQKMKAAT